MYKRQIFGSARLGIEQMRSHRNINIGGYSGVADSDWTGYSLSLIHISEPTRQ